MRDTEALLVTVAFSILFGSVILQALKEINIKAKVINIIFLIIIDTSIEYYTLFFLIRQHHLSVCFDSAVIFFIIPCGNSVYFVNAVIVIIFLRTVDKINPFISYCSVARTASISSRVRPTFVRK